MECIYSYFCVIKSNKHNTVKKISAASIEFISIIDL